MNTIKSLLASAVFAALFMAILTASAVARADAANDTTRYRVSGNSMAPTLLPGDTVEVDKNAYVTESPQVNDLVSIVFSNRHRPMVKRVVAVAGDTVRLDADGLWRNDEKVKNMNVASHGGRTKALAAQLRSYQNQIPDGNVILSGDNAKRSLDSLRYGLVSVEQINGKVIVIKKRKQN